MTWIQRAAICLIGAGLRAALHGEPPDAAPLSEEVLAAAIRTDQLTIPSPGELMAALNKIGKPDWTGEIRPPVPMTFSTRAQMALNLGSIVADGYIAVEAEDAQQVKNVGADILNLAKPLSVQQDIFNRGKSLTEFAEHGQWDTLKEEFECTQNEVKGAMADNKDQDLITLVTLGGWIRGTEVISHFLMKHYSEAGAKLLRQPAIVAYLSARLQESPEKVRDNPTVRQVRADLPKIQLAVSFPRDETPNLEAVKNLYKLTSALMNEISKKDAK